MRSPRPWLGIALALVALGCAAAPNLTPDIIGVGDLASQSMEVPDRPDTSQLPKLSLDCSSSADSDCVSERPVYRVGPRDEISVFVWGRPDLGSQMRGESGFQPASPVSQDGTIFLPFLQPVPVAGLSQAEIRTLIEELYTTVLEEKPQIDVRLLTCGSLPVDVTGEIARPGTYRICENMVTVGEMLFEAGGLSKDAHAGRGVLVRDGAPFLLDYRQPVSRTASDVLLEAGDKIYFPSFRDRVVYIFGEVPRQGVFQIPTEGKDVLAALAESGGPHLVTGRARSFFLIRPSASGRTVYRLDMTDLLTGPEIALVDGDRLFVPPTSLATWNRWWRQFLPTALYRGVNDIYR